MAGTIPIEIDVEGSDLDVICDIQDKLEFEKSLTDCFSEFNIKVESFEINGETAVVGSFSSLKFLARINPPPGRMLTAI